jgi:photosystem II stability/assembly factor-like uncharacterized protein
MLKTRTSLALSLAVLAAASSLAQLPDSKLYDGLKWREIGPMRGGRSNAVSGAIGRPNEYYMGTCGGGLWKTTDGGTNWACVSDGFFKTGSVGGIGVSESNPDVVYVGMGETQLRGNVSHGDGVYKSTDAGKTWTNVGLRETRHIARVRVHPTNPDVVWVAAMGHVYGPNPERGIFKTTDGGRTWRKVLFVSDRAGACDISVDRNDANVLYAGTWEAFRTPWSLSSGGPGSKLWKSTDGGETWQDISANPGLPKETMGKIGVSVSPADSTRVYAIIEAHDGGIFSSDDAGATWTKVNDNRNYRQRAFYYTRILADPKEKDGVYVMNVGFARSSDGGKTWRGIGTPHSDNHDLWINPNDPQDMINANDGGGNVTKDGGRTWTEQDFPTAQFYHATTDNAFPYRIYGAQQDNSTVRIASMFPGGIGRDAWISTAGGESGYVAVKPDDPEIVIGANYSGDLELMNHRTGLGRNINAWPDNPMGHGAIDLVQRFQWTFPILFSPHDPDVLYVCSQFVLRSTNLGGSWTKISPDLTKSDPRTLQSSGGPITKDNTGVEYYGTVFTLAESPIVKGLMWAGSDDGLVHVTRNGGRNWEKVTPRGMPEWGLCSMIEASPHSAGTAFLAVDNHESDDFRPYIYITDDYGKSWRNAVRGIPSDTFVRVVREDPARKGLLYAGTESGVFVSFDSGANWAPLQMNLPIVPVHDLTIKEDDLIAATHGRAFWVLDDLSPVRQAADLRTANKVLLYKPSDATRARVGGFGGGRRGGGGGGAQATEPMGENPMTGAVVSYYLPTSANDVKVEYLDKSGTVVGSVATAGKSAGFHRATATGLSYPGYQNPQGMLMWGAGGRSTIPAPPGEYAVRLTVDGQVLTQTFRWTKDPRSPATDAELVAQYELAKRISDRTMEANDVVVKVRSIREQVGKAVEAHPSLKGDADTMMAKFEEVENAIYQTKAQSGQDLLNYPIKLNNRIAALMGVVLGGEYGPTAQCYEVFDMLSKLLDTELAKMKRLEDGDLKALNAKLAALGAEPVVPKGLGT